MTLVPQLQKANKREMIFQAITSELDRTDALRSDREQKLIDQLAAIEKEQVNARDRESHNATLLRENREATEKMMQEASKFTAANERMMQDVANQFTAALGMMTQLSSRNLPHFPSPIPPAPQPPYKRRKLGPSTSAPSRGLAPKQQISSVLMEDGEIPQLASMRGVTCGTPRPRPSHQ